MSVAHQLCTKARGVKKNTFCWHDRNVKGETDYTVSPPQPPVYWVVHLWRTQVFNGSALRLSRGLQSLFCARVVKSLTSRRPHARFASAKVPLIPANTKRSFDAPCSSSWQAENWFVSVLFRQATVFKIEISWHASVALPELFFKVMR